MSALRKGKDRPCIPRQQDFIVGVQARAGFAVLTEPDDPCVISGPRLGFRTDEVRNVVLGIDPIETAEPLPLLIAQHGSDLLRSEGVVPAFNALAVGVLPAVKPAVRGL